MSRFGTSVSLAFAVLFVVGCAQQSDPGADAVEVAAPESEATNVIVQLEPKSDSGVTGTASFMQQDGEVMLHIEIENAPPGEHAFHIHEFGDCSSADGKSAGGHWNPTEMDHGSWGADAHHFGDVGNILIAEDGTGTFDMTTAVWSIGGGEPNDILGKSVILHAGVDDFTTQPTGAAGGRIACGVIE